MLTLLTALIDHIRRAWSTALSEQFHIWCWPLVAYVLVAGVWALYVNRHQGLFWRGIATQIFPRKAYGERSARLSHIHYVLLIFVWSPLIAAATAFLQGDLGTELRDFLNSYLGARPAILHATWAIVALQVIVIDCIRGLAGWTVHYAFHKVPMLWSFHRVHHSVEALTLPASARNHPIENLLVDTWAILCSGAGIGILLYLTGTALSERTVALLTAIYFWKQFVDQFNHTHVPISFGWLNRLIESPILHQIHHSAERHHRDKNFGSLGLIGIWDWVFGTLYLPDLPEKKLQYRWGLNDLELGPNNPHVTLRGFYAEPFRHLWQTVKSRRDRGRMPVEHA